MVNRFLQIALVLVVGILMTGCEKEGAMEQAGKAVDEAAEDAGKAIKDAQKKVEDAVDDQQNK
jgi:Sec-independent protein translocase protein TatA